MTDFEFRKTPALLASAGAFFIILSSILIHKLSSLPQEYTWTRAASLLWQSITDAHFMTAAFFVLLASYLLAPPQKTYKNATSAFVTITIVLIILVSNPKYTPVDYLLMPAAAFLFYKIFNTKNALIAATGAFGSIVALTIASYSFTILKSQLFLKNAPLDQTIIGLETIILGTDTAPHKIIAEYAAKHPFVVYISDRVYYLFFHHIALVALFLFATRSHLEQLRYITSLLTCYLLGALFYYITPTLGPIYFDQPSFGYVAKYAPFTSKIQDLLFFFTEQSIQGKLQTIETFAFIAGTPSLHMAHESIMLYFSRRSALMFLISAALWIASFVAVLVLGWHYPTDVLAGVLLAAIAIWISSNIFKKKQTA